MDCERFEANLIDELYDELDELTSAAAKRHVAGCARCASLLGGLRATRRVAVLSMVEPSGDLEERILAAARNAQKVVPVGRRLSRAVSLAGSWAMRPQTAMAAVFILIVGWSVLLVRRNKIADSGSVTVTAHGQPAAESAPSPSASTDAPAAPLDSKVAAAAHGAPNNYAPTPTASAAPTNEGALAYRERPATAKGAPEPIAAALPPPSPPAGQVKDSDDSSNLPKVAGSVAPGWGSAPMGPRAAQPGSGGGQGISTPQNDRGGAADFAEALRDANRTRDTNGCGAATEGFDRIAQEAWGTQAGYEATFNAGQCYKELGKTDLALQRFRSLITVTRYASLAQTQINNLSASQNQAQLAAARATSAPAKKPATKAWGGKPSQSSASASAPVSTSNTQEAPAQAAPTAPAQQQWAH
jgi:hypothetical protein